MPDGRTALGKELRERRAALMAQAGGNPDATQRLKIELILEYRARLELLDVHMATSGDVAQWQHETHAQWSAVLLKATAEFEKLCPEKPKKGGPRFTKLSDLTEEELEILANDSDALMSKGADKARAMLRVMQAMDGMTAEELEEEAAAIERGAGRVVMVLPDNGRGDGPPVHMSKAGAKIATKLEGIRDRLEAGGAPVLHELPPEPVGDSQTRAEPEPVRVRVGEPSANPDSPQRQQSAKQAQPARELPPNVTVDEIEPQPRAGATVWTGGRD
jgi:hypothetical protein